MKIKKFFEKIEYYMDYLLLNDKERYYHRIIRDEKRIAKAIQNREIVDIEYAFAHGSKVEKMEHAISIKPRLTSIVNIDEGSLSVSHVVLRNDKGNRDYLSNMVIIECETNLDIKDIYIYSIMYGYLHFKISTVSELGEKKGLKKLRLYTILQPFEYMKNGKVHVKNHLESYKDICLDHLSYRDTLKLKFRVLGINGDKDD